jgi:hypothetical protein
MFVIFQLRMHYWNLIMSKHQINPREIFRRQLSYTCPKNILKDEGRGIDIDYR